MNHVLDHQGFRFFQASFDPDENGTILSVNKDPWGTFDHLPWLYSSLYRSYGNIICKVH